MDYRKLLGCGKCSNYTNNDCIVKSKFDDDDPSTCPFLCCPFFRFNYDIIIPKSGDLYIYEEDGIFFTPVFPDYETSDYFDLRKCEIYSENNKIHLNLDMHYLYILRKEKQFVIENCKLIHIDTTAII